MASALQAFAAFRPADFKPRIGLLLGLTDPVCGLNMGETAEVLAREFGITPRRAGCVCACNRISAPPPRAKNWPRKFARSFQAGKRRSSRRTTASRENQSLDALAKLKPLFDRKNGTVTAGNASQITDGAVALLVMSESRAKELGFTPLGALTGYAYAGCDPARMGLGPVFAIARAEEQTEFTLADADIIEINEAFAAQVLAVIKCAASEEFAREQLASRRAARRNSGGKIKRQRRRHRARPSGRRDRRAAGADGVEGIETAQRQTRAGVVVHRRRPGRGAVAGKDVSS